MNDLKRDAAQIPSGTQNKVTKKNRLKPVSYMHCLHRNSVVIKPGKFECQELSVNVISSMHLSIGIRPTTPGVLSGRMSYLLY